MSDAVEVVCALPYKVRSTTLVGLAKGLMHELFELARRDAIYPGMGNMSPTSTVHIQVKGTSPARLPFIQLPTVTLIS